jgi:hypothetical protein
MAFEVEFGEVSMPLPNTTTGLVLLYPARPAGELNP